MVLSNSPAHAPVRRSREARGMNILAPISVGELIDKITILRIKRNKIRDAAKQGNIGRELEQLTQIRLRSELNTAGLSALEDQLFQINLRLWQVEDDLRALDHKGNFGEHFVELARLVYQLNDARMAVKKEINEVTGSAIVEEKFYSSDG
jgi:hypothetical protein